MSDCEQSRLNTITELRLGSPYIEGLISNFGAGSSITRLVINNTTSIKGNIESIGNKQNILSIEIYNSGVTGSIDAYVASAINSGLTSKNKLSVVGALTQLTFNGVKQNVSGISTVAPCWISWDGTGKISVITGSYQIANCTHVFCKGYTQSEAESAFPGMTIRRVDA